jgi:mannitol-1-phosphate 5-dehydrogenase
MGRVRALARRDDLVNTTNKNPTVLMIGSGAIGRGYMPWLFDESVEFSFVDSNTELLTKLKKQGGYTTYKVEDGKAIPRYIKPSALTHISELNVSAMDHEPLVVFVSVGPRNCLKVLEKLESISAPIVLCENDEKLVDLGRRALGKSNIYFGVPDVITSNTASPEQVADDPLAIVTESGVMFADEGAKFSHSTAVDINWCSSKELEKQWLAKLFLHNTPHCIAAYLGALNGKKYVHEAMAVESINEIVRGSMNEMLKTLKVRYQVDPQFLDWYAAKELRRFEQVLLFDPISRVAREPLRKLERDGRLLGAAQMCLSAGVVPENILVGIVSAILFQNESDPDHHLQIMRDAMSMSVFLSYVLGIREQEVLHQLIAERFDAIQARLGVR